MSFIAAMIFAVQGAPPAVTAPSGPLLIEQQSALRCSIALAMAAEQQRAGQAGGKNWPDITTRGREFFVRSLAKLMDEARLTRPSLTTLVQREVAELEQPGRLDAVMPACLLLLDASGL